LKKDEELSSNPEELCHIAAIAATDAGRKLLKLFRGSRKLLVKPKHDYPGSLVTNADIHAEKIILRRIRNSRLKCTVNSEEAGLIDLGSRRIVFAVDPLDGTLNYAKGIPYFAVSIGVLVDRRPVAGAIYDPILDKLYTASEGNGAMLDGKSIQVSNTRTLRNSALIFEWWEHESSIPDPVEFEKQLYHYTRRLRSPGSIALNLCSVASGRFDGLVTIFEKTPVFETAAGCLILEEANGVITDSSGGDWRSYSGSIFAGGRRIHDGLLRIVSRL
jgi:myo-inositol-1(or 4)-monophosphatase